MRQREKKKTENINEKENRNDTNVDKLDVPAKQRASNVQHDERHGTFIHWQFHFAIACVSSVRSWIGNAVIFTFAV